MSAYGVGERGSWDASADMDSQGSKPGDAILQSVGGIQRLASAGIEVSLRGDGFVGLNVIGTAKCNGKRVSFICIRRDEFDGTYDAFAADQTGLEVGRTHNLRPDDLRGTVEAMTGFNLSQ